MAAVVDEELSEQLQAAPFYSILIHESTDISVDHTLIRYVHVGEVCMRFFDITELSSGTVSAILETILCMLDRKKLPLEKAYGMATNGASVMHDWCACRSHYSNEKEESIYALNSLHCTSLSSSKWTRS